MEIEFQGYLVDDDTSILRHLLVENLLFKKEKKEQTFLYKNCGFI